MGMSTALAVTSTTELVSTEVHGPRLFAKTAYSGLWPPIRKSKIMRQ